MSEQFRKPSNDLIPGQGQKCTRLGAAPSTVQPFVGPPHLRSPINMASPSHGISQEKLSGWSGAIQIEGVIEKAGEVLRAKDIGVTPDFYRLYARKIDGSLQTFSDFRTEKQARDVAERLIEVCTMISNVDFWRCNEDFERLLASQRRKPPKD